MTGRLRWITLAAAAGIATNVATPERAGAQACTAGPLSAYLASAGLGCTINQLRMKNFSAPSFLADANNIFLNPFVLAGPPGFTWIGFNFTFQSAPIEARRGISFFSEGAPLYGMLARQDILTASRRLHGRVTGDGGYFRTDDFIKGDLSRLEEGCAKYGAAPEACTPGHASFVGNAMPDADNGYQVDVTTLVHNDFTVAVLVESATVTPEPASLLLLSTGLGGIGAMVRRRKRAV